MARGLENYQNIDGPDSDYPNGKIRDDDGSNNGTPVDTEVYGDIHQFLAKLLRAQGITPNGLPDNEYSGQQYYQALIDCMNNNIGSDIILSLIGPYTPDDVIILWGSFTNPTTFNYVLSNGAAYYNGKIYKFVPYSAGDPLHSWLAIDSSDNPAKIIVSTSGIAVYSDSRIKYLPGIVSYKNAAGATSLILPPQKKIFEIGVWNMDSTSTINVPIDIPRTKVIRATAMIFNDVNTLSISLETVNGNNSLPLASGGTITVQNTFVLLARTTSGLFDGVGYDDAVMNRGLLIIEYML